MIIVENWTTVIGSKLPIPGRMNQRSPQAGLQLKFIIVGGSLAGLSAGYALSRAGHEVLILEQDAESAQVSRVSFLVVQPY